LTPTQRRTFVDTLLRFEAAFGSATDHASGGQDPPASTP
jgi:hypothetical protein